MRLEQYVFGYARVRLKSIAEISTGSHNMQDAIENGKYPFYTRSNVLSYLNTFDYDEQAIITAGDGNIGDVIQYVDGKYALHQRAYRVRPDISIIMPKFVYYWFKHTFKKYIVSVAVDSSVKSIRKKMMEDFVVDVPSIEEQQRVVSVLDKFSSLISSLSDGLPAEIQSSEERYEYYRDHLLTF